MWKGVLAIAKSFGGWETYTEIKVCEEKIADAAANGDSKAKYRLMRIKSQLEKEAARVKSNSMLI